MIFRLVASFGVFLENLSDFSSAGVFLANLIESFHVDACEKEERDERFSYLFIRPDLPKSIRRGGERLDLRMQHGAAEEEQRGSPFS